MHISKPIYLIFPVIFTINAHCENGAGNSSQLISDKYSGKELKVELGKDLHKEITKPSKQQLNYIPPNGYVPDEKTAIAIAVAVWSAIYGEKEISLEKPYIAKLSNGVWHIEGSLPKGWDGGVAEAEINQTDAKVIRVIHGK